MSEHSAQPTSSPEVTPEIDRTSIQYKADLIVSSFRFSQGSSPLGAQLVSHLVHTYPELFPDKIIPGEVIDAAVPIAQRIRNTSHPDYIGIVPNGGLTKPLAAADIRDNIKKQTRNGGGYSKDSHQIQPASIAERILESDAHFLLDSDALHGRYKPGRLLDGRSQPASARFLSHYFFYGLAGHSAGTEEYNQLFASISSPETILRVPDFEPSIISLLRFQRTLLAHLDHFPADLELIADEKKEALREAVYPEAAAALGL